MPSRGWALHKNQSTPKLSLALRRLGDAWCRWGFFPFFPFFISFVFSSSSFAPVVTQQCVHIVHIDVSQMCIYGILYAHTAGARHYEAVGILHYTYSVVFVLLFKAALDFFALGFRSFLAVLLPLPCCARAAPHASCDPGIGISRPHVLPRVHRIFSYDIRDDYSFWRIVCYTTVYLRIDDSTVLWDA